MGWGIVCDIEKLLFSFLLFTALPPVIKVLGRGRELWKGRWGEEIEP